MNLRYQELGETKPIVIVQVETELSSWAESVAPVNAKTGMPENVVVKSNFTRALKCTTAPLGAPGAKTCPIFIAPGFAFGVVPGWLLKQVRSVGETFAESEFDVLMKNKKERKRNEEIWKKKKNEKKKKKIMRKK